MVIIRDFRGPGLTNSKAVVGEAASKFVCSQLNEGLLTPKVSGIYQVLVTIKANKDHNVKVLNVVIR